MRSRYNYHLFSAVVKLERSQSKNLSKDHLYNYTVLMQTKKREIFRLLPSLRPKGVRGTAGE